MFSKVQSQNYEVKIITGRFDVATSTGTATKEAGLGYTVAKTATGEYTITLADKYSAVLSAVAVPQSATVLNMTAQIKSASASVVVINLVKLAATIDQQSTITVAAAASDAACKVNFVIHLQRTSLPAV